MNVIQQWFRDRFSDPQVVILVLLILLGVGVVLFLGGMLVPVFASLILAYLLEGGVRFTCRAGIPRRLAVPIVFVLFMGLVLAALLILVPLLTEQIGQLLNQLPSMLARGQEILLQLPKRYPALIGEDQVREVVRVIKVEAMRMGQDALSFSLASIRSIMTMVVYIVLVPMLIFFFLKDKVQILDWLKGFVPEHRGLTAQVWREVHLQTSNYVRGKVWEILIVWAATYVTFLVFGMDFALLLSLLVGLSVLIPYIGAAVVTLPVALVAFYQWGWSADLAYVLIAYGVIQALDGNVLVPILLSEVVNLHPIAIIVAVLVFGGLWGFWGVFFAIPLATLVQAVIKSLPRRGPAPSPVGCNGKSGESP